MNFRISPVIRKGIGHRVRLWRAIRTLPEDWIVRERAEARMARQLALTTIRVGDPPEVDRAKRALYAQLDEVERSYLHEEVGAKLEQLYGNRTEEAAVELSRHFDEAGITDKAVDYLRVAGE